MVIKGSGSDGVHLAGGNTFVANDVDIVGVAPAVCLGDSFRTGDGERYGVSFNDTSVFNTSNVNVTVILNSVPLTIIAALGLMALLTCKTLETLNSLAMVKLSPYLVISEKYIK